MTITTFSRREALRETHDTAICEALTALTTPPLVEEYQVLTGGRWWQRPRPQTRYSVLWPLGDTLLGPEWQVVNFYREDSGTSINTAIPKELVLAYLYGYGAAQHQQEEDAP